MAVEFTVPDAQLRRLGEQLVQAERIIGTAEPLLKRFGVTILKEIDTNFRVGGRPAWKPLAAWTQAARRGGKGGQILQNTGKLAKSFDFVTEPHKLTVFSRSPLAIFHEIGTKGPYEIRPKHGKALALPAGPYSLRGLGRARATGRGSFIVGKGATGRLKSRVGK